MADLTENICAMVDKQLIEDILKNDYGFINGKIRELDGYDDKNYHITEIEKHIEGIEFPVDGIVLKFINSIDSKNLSLLEAQTKLTQYLENFGIICPTPLLNKYRQSYGSVIINDKMHAVRAYRYIRGETMNNVIVNSEISTDFGSYVGHLTSILKEFNHDGFHRNDFLWALEKSPEVLKYVDVFNQEKQQIITTILNKFQSTVLSKSHNFTKSVIHGDLNMNNIILKDKKIHGIIDIGDVIYSFTIFDFSVSLCYLILHEFRNNNAKLSDVKIKSFVDAYENHYEKLNSLEYSVIHVSDYAP
uniref:Hydroxylysine kinase n=1 Tax=Sipha flava TaxID=143950 RepID=A0A2S2Q788_9HEMI